MNKFLEKVGLKEVDPKELLKEWQTKMRAEKRSVERQMREIEREQKKLEVEIKKLAKRGGQQNAIKILAKEIVQSRKTIERLYVACANIDSVNMQMRQMAAQATFSKVMKGSADTMKRMNQLMNLPETQKTMMELGREMEKAGFIQEMMDDAFDDQTNEDEVNEEVDKVIMEVTLGKLDSVPLAQKGCDLFRKSMSQREELEVEEEDPEVANLEMRLKNLS